jgi:hypothetical protein
MKRSLPFFIACLTCVATSLSAADPELTFTNPRVMGMGGAGIALCSDDSALYLNPAGLARITQTRIKGPRLRFEIGQELISNMSNLSKLKGSQDTSVVNKLIGMDGSSNLAGQVASYESPGFGVSALWGSDIYSSVGSNASYTLKAAMDMGLNAGYALRFDMFGQQVDGGVTGKFLSRTLAYDPVTGKNEVELSDADLISVVNSSDKLSQKIKTFTATGFGLDLGFLTDIALGSQPATLGLAIRNLGASLTGSRVVASQNTTATVVIPVSTVVGVALVPDVPVLGVINLAADYTLSPNTSFYKGIHIGAEKKILSDSFVVRGGINQGYIVMGFGLDMIGVKFDYTFYGKEQGDKAGETPDIYHSVQLGVVF